MNSIIQYCIIDPAKNLILSKLNLYGYTKDSKNIYNLSFVGDMANALLMNRPQAQERLSTLKSGIYEYRVVGCPEVSVNDLEIKKVEVSYLLLD